jgi:hypothetical protein
LLIDDETGFTKEYKFEVISNMWSNLTQLVSTKFPDRPIVIALGNNDNLVNYLPAGSVDPSWKQKMYSKLWEIFFENIPANLKGQPQADIDKMKSDFMAGGYFKYT